MYPTFLVIVLCQEIRIAKENDNNINTVNMVVEYPLKDLCFSTLSNVQERSVVVDSPYNLIGTVNYKANTKGSHYTAITKNADNWHCFDDHLVSIISFRFRKK